jgi:hypothetical protein
VKYDVFAAIRRRYEGTLEWERRRRQARLTLRYCTAEQLERERQAVEAARATGKSGWVTECYDQAIGDIEAEQRGK